jgi:hypothetical protein
MKRAHVFVVGWLVAWGSGAALGGCSASASMSTSPTSLDGKVYAVSADAPEVERSGTSLGDVHVGNEVCAGADLTSVYGGLRVDAFTRFLEEQGIDFEKVNAREDLHYVDVNRDGRVVRLRVATLQTAREAARDLHEAMLEHGQGSWGVHRGNLAVLGPVSDVDDILAFAIEAKLVCWGVLSIAGRDDNFVVPGGYAQL